MSKQDNSNLDVVILAAGRGSRLRPLTDNTPKCMIEVDEEPIIGRILGQFATVSRVENIYVVTGYKHGQLSRYLSQAFPQVHCIHNKDYARTNNMYSLGLYFEQGPQDRDLILLNADCVYEDQIVESCVSTTGSCIMADSSVSSEEAMKIRVEKGQVRAMSKKLDAEKENVWASIDLYKFNCQLVQALARIVTGYIKKGDQNKWTEVAIHDLVSEGKADIEARDITPMGWYEIDTPADLQQARNLFSYAH